MEGDVDEAVVARLVRDAGAVAGPIHGRRGKDYLRRQLPGYNNAARHTPWVVLVDLDDKECAPILIEDWLPNPSPLMRLRVAVREVEAWLLADRERVARLLSVSQRRVPLAPETLTDPKSELIHLAGRSRSRLVRDDFVPRPESRRRVGPGYQGRLIDFASDRDKGWRPHVAAESAPSLARFIERLNELASAQA